MSEINVILLKNCQKNVNIHTLRESFYKLKGYFIQYHVLPFYFCRIQQPISAHFKWTTID